MVRLFTLTDPRMAQAFIDYMASRDIEIKMMPEGGGQFVLWLTQAEHQIEAEAELKQFLANPAQQKYQKASWDMAETRVNRFHYASPSILGMITAKAGPVTLFVMLLCIGVFSLQQLGASKAVFTALHFPANVGQEWQLWRWISHALLHFSLLHLAFNLLWWWQLGGDIEKYSGRGKVLQLFVVSAALSGAGQYWAEGANFGGLSGVIYALVGYIWMIGYKVPQLGLNMPKPVIGFMLVWLVLGFVQPFIAMANTVHLVGMVVGVIMGLLDASKLKAQ